MESEKRIFEVKVSKIPHDAHGSTTSFGLCKLLYKFDTLIVLNYIVQCMVITVGQVSSDKLQQREYVSHNVVTLLPK